MIIKSEENIIDTDRSQTKI